MVENTDRLSFSYIRPIALKTRNILSVMFQDSFADSRILKSFEPPMAVDAMWAVLACVYEGDPPKRSSQKR